jgi:hypothetical protein
MNNIFTIVVFNIKNSRKDIFKALLLIGFLLGTMQFMHAWREIPYGNLLRDPNAIANLPRYNGFISQFGIFLWFASVGICFLGYFLTKGIESVKKKSSYLLYFGIFSLMLGLDDAYMIHEGSFESFLFGIYAFLMLVFILLFSNLFFQTNFILMLFSGLFLASSIAADIFIEDLFFLEDALKISGIVFWFVYFFRTVYTFCRGVIRTDV